MEDLRDNDGYLVLDKLPFKMLDDKMQHIIFYIDGVKYYFKHINDKKDIYSELIAEELAKDFGIDCAHYDLANYRGLKGVISEDFIKDDKYISLNDIVNDYYGKEETANAHNNLIDIWSALDFRYKDENISNELMEEIVNMFIFDVLVAQGDRHLNNYGILENETEIKIAPLFDNTYILSDLVINHGWFSLGVDKDQNIYADDFDDSKDKILVKFLKESSSEYMDLLESKLWIISEENIDKVLKRVEDKINEKIDDKIKNDIKVDFSINYNSIQNIIDYVKERKVM